MDSSNSCDEGDQDNNQIRQHSQRIYGEQQKQQTSKQNMNLFNEVDDYQQYLQNHDYSSEQSILELGGFEPFDFPISMMENKNKTRANMYDKQRKQYFQETTEGITKYLSNNSNYFENSTQTSTEIALQQRAKNKKKRKFDTNLIASLFNYQIGEQTKFYLFADQVVDIDYLKLLAKNQEEEKSYTHDENKACVFKGFKFINQVCHRIDNKCIEIFSEEANKPFENMEQIISMILSLGDQNLMEIANSLQLFWSNILKYKNTIKEQSEDELFKSHMIERDKASYELFEKMSSEIDQDKFITYVYFKIDYSNYRVYNYRTGYSPKFYELIAGNAYAFKESLLKDGQYDAIFIANRFNRCLSNAISYFGTDNVKKKYYQSKLNDSFNLIRTLDGLYIPSNLKSKITNLNAAYDSENKLKFKVNDLFLINDFELTEEKEDIESQLREFRIGSKNSHVGDQKLKEDDKISLEKQFKTEVFLQKYYSDDITSLMNKGNKWFKECGVADIPQKKRKEEEQ